MTDTKRDKPARKPRALQAMLAPSPQRPLDYLHYYWREVSPDDRLRFLVEMLTPAERRALMLGFEDEGAYVSLPWQFAQGQRVCSSGWLAPGTVVQQRVTLRDVFGPVCEYLVQPPWGPCQWINEADLTAAEEPTL